MTMLARLLVDVRRERSKMALRPAKPWPVAELPDDRALARIAAATADFWEFDRLYFPPEVYTQGHAEPGDYHRHLVDEAQRPGVYVHLGARIHGKTVTVKKLLAWLLLTGNVTIAGTLSQKLDVARNILADVVALIRDNPRIVHDWRPRFAVCNADAMQMVTEREGTSPLYRYAQAFSEGRSVRGYARGFARPEWIICDDLENRKSPMGDEQVKRRIKVLQEASKSMATPAGDAPGGTLVCLGNDFDERCAMHRLLTQYETAGGSELPPSWRVEKWPAWIEAPRVVHNSDGGTFEMPTGPLWRARFSAATVAELRRKLEPADEDEWQGEFLQNPQPPEGNVFRAEHYREFDALPSDARGVVYCDPNLSLKGKGDTTAITALLYSPATLEYYVSAARCISFSDSNALLSALLDVRDGVNRAGYGPDEAGRSRVVAVGFDGNVSQESTWTNHVRNWCRINTRPFPRLVWCRYRVDDLAKNTQAAWTAKQISFPKGFAQTEEGRRYLAQLYAFRGKRSPSEQNDDAPDSLICADELLHERGVVKRPEARSSAAVNIQDDMSW
jgi:hypothetical protein